jgi:3-oxoacyl-[acyl-carrier protein] reductase
MSEASLQVALVTGASRGIGAACARRLAADGMVVAINSLEDERMTTLAEQVAADIRRAGGQAAVYPADISDPVAVDGMFERCESELGRVYALVLNAAATARRPWDEIPEDEWQRIIAVNLTGALRCCQRAFGRSHHPGGGVIVTVSSVMAKVGAPDALHYATTKAGVLGFTRSLARELGERGTRVNCVMPGAIRTEAELESFPEQEEVERAVLSRQALQRRGVAEDIAGVVSFLVGPDSNFMTGQTLCVDGGWVLL